MAKKVVGYIKLQHFAIAAIFPDLGEGIVGFIDIAFIINKHIITHSGHFVANGPANSS